MSLLGGTSVAVLIRVAAVLLPLQLDRTVRTGDVILASVLLLFFWCNFYFTIKQWQRSAEERERLARAEADAREAHLSALRYQLNPHFLFISLNAVSTLVLQGNGLRATQMLAQISDLLRISLGHDVALEVPFSEEMAFTEQYLAIEQTRMGRRLQMAFNIPTETLDGLVPSMFLQPLVENAVRHGVAPLREGGTISIESQLQGGQLQIVIKNPGPCRSAVALSNKTANGIGLTNTAERLQTLYGDNHRFVQTWPVDGGCEVVVEVPFRKVAPPIREAPCAR